MSTRGAVGIRYKGEDKIGYNHCDSYPTGLGRDILKYLTGKDFKDLVNDFSKIDITGSADGWNDGLCKFNYNIKDYKDFLKDSLFCEYAYIINLDSGMLEFYTGFNKDPNAPGRYAKFSTDEHNRYFGVRLEKELFLDDCSEGLWLITKDDKFVKKGDEEMQEVETIWHSVKNTDDLNNGEVLLKYKGGSYVVGEIQDKSFYVDGEQELKDNISDFIYIKDLK